MQALWGVLYAQGISSKTQLGERRVRVRKLPLHRYANKESKRKHSVGDFSLVPWRTSWDDLHGNQQWIQVLVPALWLQLQNRCHAVKTRDGQAE